MDLPIEIQKVLDKIERLAKPVSIFVYGSRARTDFENESDYEVGVLFKRDKKWGRGELAQLHSIGKLNLYPFIYEDFVKYRLDTPFPRAIYARQLIESAKSVRGIEVVEQMKLPEILPSDLLEGVLFDTGYALAAILSSRQEDWLTASQEFAKSVLYGAQVLVILEKKKFPLTYDEILSDAIGLDLDEEFNSLLSRAMDVRRGTKLDDTQLYTNVSFLNQVVYERVKTVFNRGNKAVLRGVKV